MNDLVLAGSWLRPLNTTELLALVSYGEPLLEELAPMQQVGALNSVLVLGDALVPLREALATEDSRDVAPAAPAVRLGDGVWVVLPRDVRQASRRLAAVAATLREPGLQRPLEALRRIYREASAGERALLLAGVDEAALPSHVMAAQNNAGLTDDVARLRRQLTLRAHRVLGAALHTPGAGLDSDATAERWRAFIEVSEVLVSEGKVHPAAVSELEALFVPLLSGLPGRHQAALLVGLIAAALRRSESAGNDAVENELRRNLGILGEGWSEGDWPGVLDEATPAACICLALAAVAVGFAGAEVLEAVTETAHAPLRRAIAKESAGYEQAIELALRLAQSEG